ncbi:phage tail assembly protein T [Chitinasiproducens palmae]|uniref:phage tail assembly protein T n=1 Tax=Chitinasiproducens palmae TaxID=1770053 RepID=UPI001480FE83|nr:hypothetical protein [Chitinasiproducens palmae]
MPVRRLLQEIDSQEFTHWLAFYNLEPWGSLLDDLRAGTIASMVGNVNRDAKRRPQPFGPLEFMPWGDRSGQRSADEPLFTEDRRQQSGAILYALFGVVRNGKKRDDDPQPGGTDPGVAPAAGGGKRIGTAAGKRRGRSNRP